MNPIYQIEFFFFSIILIRPKTVDPQKIPNMRHIWTNREGKYNKINKFRDIINKLKLIHQNQAELDLIKENINYYARKKKLNYLRSRIMTKGANPINSLHKHRLNLHQKEKDAAFYR